MAIKNSSRNGVLSKFFRGTLLSLTALAFVLALACEPAAEEEEQAEAMPQEEITKYRAAITSLNSDWSDMQTTGTAVLLVGEDSLTIRVRVENLPRSMMHLMHYHGFVNGDDATCATIEDDTNGDGVVDLIETQAVSGITLVPFHDNPASMNIKVETYPMADSTGTLTYEKTVALDSLRKGLANVHGIAEPMFENRVFYIHGVRAEANLPESVQSLPDVPARVSLPIGCGKFELIEPTEQMAEEEGGYGY